MQFQETKNPELYVYKTQRKWTENEIKTILHYMSASLRQYGAIEKPTATHFYQKLLRECNFPPNATVPKLQAKLHHLKKKFIAAVKWCNEAGQGVLREEGSMSFKAKLNRMCPYYDLCLELWDMNMKVKSRVRCVMDVKMEPGAAEPLRPPNAEESEENESDNENDNDSDNDNDDDNVLHHFNYFLQEFEESPATETVNLNDYNSNTRSITDHAESFSQELDNNTRKPSTQINPGNPIENANGKRECLGKGQFQCQNQGNPKRVRHEGDPKLSVAKDPLNVFGCEPLAQEDESYCLPQSMRMRETMIQKSYELELVKHELHAQQREGRSSEQIELAKVTLEIEKEKTIQKQLQVEELKLQIELRKQSILFRSKEAVK